MKGLSRSLEFMRIVVTIGLIGCPGFQWAAADTHYVSLDGGNVSPYTNGWTSAATSIQLAIDAAVAFDTVLVSNGVYQTGGLTNYPAGGLLTNRVVFTRFVTLRSFNDDPTNTIIKGAGPCGPGAVRCVYGNNQNNKLIGFTVIGGATLLTGGAGGEDRNGGGVWGGNTMTISNCIIVGNTADFHGGGAIYANTYNSLIISNTASIGGGQSQGSTRNCIIRYNKGTGAGTWGANMYGCVVDHNNGSGAVGNPSKTYYNSVFYCNQSAGIELHRGNTVDCCTIVGNLHGFYVEGGYTSTVLNSIIYSNKYNQTIAAGNAIWFTNSCTFPANPAAWAPGNITNNPMFVDIGSGAYGTNFVAGDYHLSSRSPCINAGLNEMWMAGALDVDGNKRVDPGSLQVDMGCYEYVFPGGTLIQIR